MSDKEKEDIFTFIDKKNDLKDYCMDDEAVIPVATDDLPKTNADKSVSNSVDIGEVVPEDNKAIDEAVSMVMEDVEKDAIESVKEESVPKMKEEKVPVKEKKPEKPKKEKPAKTGKGGSKVKKVILRAFAVLGVTLLLLVGAIYGICFVLINGPSETAKNQFVCSVKETSAMGWVAHLFLSSKEINQIINDRGMIEVDDGTVSNPNLIVIPPNNEEQDSDTPDIEVIDIMGTTYRGKLMIIKDPSRVFVGTVPKFYDGVGMVVAKMAERYGAVAGINGGEFYDKGTVVYTARPVGCVITNGELVYGEMNKTYRISGFTEDNVFVIGKMTPKKALEMGVRDALHTEEHTGPFLVLNGEVLVEESADGDGGGKNPRTAIGQRADGAVLMLVVDGRQANSIGATFAELAYIMLEYGAVNASAMDGGTSTQMYYNGEVINSPYSPTGPRRCPTSFLVSALAAE